jgi:Ca2+/Na+ antiporter
MSDNCNTAGLTRALNKCKFVAKNCDDQFDTFNMLYFQYCHIGNQSWIGVILSLCLLIILMRHIEHVSGDYLSVAIAALSKGLGLSEIVAGSTLLALSNGATDLITAMVSATSSNGEGLDMVIGSLYGASIFSILCIFASVIFASPDGTSLKECGLLISIPTYIAADILLLIGLFCGFPILLIGTLFIGIYYLYIRQVLLEDRHNRAEVLNKKQTNKLPSQDESVIDNHNTSTVMKDIIDQSEDIKPETVDDHGKHVARAKINKDAFIEHEEQEFNPIDSENNKMQNSLDASNLERSLEVDDPNVLAELVYRVKFEYSKEQGILAILYILEICLKLFTALIVPSVEDPFIKGVPLIVYVFTIPLFYLVTNGLLDNIITIPGLNVNLPTSLIALLLSTIIFKCCRSQYRRIMLCIASSVIMLDYLVGIIVDLLTFVKIRYAMDSFFLALTILGVANSIVDLFVDRSLAQAGLTAMAVSGVFSGQLFNLLIGMSLTGIIQTFQGTTTSTSLLTNQEISNKKAFMIASVIIFHLLALVALLSYLKSSNWMISKKVAYYLGVIYLFMLIFVTMVEFAF